MKNLVLNFSYLVLISTFSSCSTTSGSQQQDPVKIKKPITHPNPSGKNHSSIAVKPTNPTPPVEVEFSNFFERVASPDKDFTEKDRQLFITFPSSPNSGSIHEAAIVIGILRDIVTPVGGHKSTFREVDIAASNNTENANAVIETPSTRVEPSLVLETRCRERGVDCISALSRNPHLRSHAVYNMALDASRFEGNSPLFLQNLLATIKTETENWGDLARKLGLDTQPVDSQTTPVSASAPASELNQTSQPTITASAEENSAASQILAKAAEYAGKEDYDRAISEARKINEGTDNYSAAQDSLKNWANRAVQDLRRQAANQYRSSSSTTEPNTKKSHLEKAKNFLEIALAKYPEASTLDTVKENLEIINKELNRLK